MPYSAYLCACMRAVVTRKCNSRALTIDSSRSAETEVLYVRVQLCGAEAAFHRRK